jgi:hypothetical protein
MLVSGFLSYDEALQYARKLSTSEELSAIMRLCHCFIISQPNLALIGSRFSYDDYDEFYQQTFQPMEISEEQLLEIPELPEQPEEEEDDGETGEDEEEDEEDLDDDLDFF